MSQQTPQIMKQTEQARSSPDSSITTKKSVKAEEQKHDTDEKSTKILIDLI